VVLWQTGRRPDQAAALFKEALARPSAVRGRSLHARHDLQASAADLDERSRVSRNDPDEPRITEAQTSLAQALQARHDRQARRRLS